ncbi:putative bifunctional diguanylate cyclase/phosphodiesterase [Methylomonas rapida]|uniref:EAL domain-containing protein n=1 Tax=Methylomonas rapida TaxID=2963939 RepID=A0ABY7GGL5_9GAMM|nr:EAL domain-containing protein [Methylomonas rapida]WAR44400.1 EAL domain-containing protein [Methylomonas rapida]
MIIVELIKNTALLVALAAMYPVMLAHLNKSLFSQRILFGLMFGVVGVLGMMTPIHYDNDGIIFDGRSVLLAVAGLIGGPLVATLSALIMAVYRLWLGGIGAPVGISVIFATAALGVMFYFIRQRTGHYLGPLSLLGFGFLVHGVMLAIFMFLPHYKGYQVFKELGATIFLVYPLATMLISLLFQDYEEREKSRLNIEQLAYYDPLTALPNRSLLIESIDKAISKCEAAQCDGALILLNLDRFKTLNDARGHASGDVLLRAVAERINSVVEAGDMLARMSADEFAILLVRAKQNSPSIDVLADQLAEKIQIALTRPLRVDTEEITVSSSIGIASFPMDADDTTGDVLRRVDTAMHRAKTEGGNQSIIFDHSMSKSVENHFLIERELRQAVHSGQLKLFLQSQVNNAGVIVGAEALVRWQHPERGFISPTAFIHIAEESDLIIEIGRWVLTEACRLLTCEGLAGRSIVLSVNISPKQFRQPRFAASIKHLLAETGADPTHLKLEVTENLLIHNMNDVIAKMIELAALGIRFSLDDFGTGYSSLAYLKRLPIQELKIDRSFVQDVTINPDDATLVESILAVAKHMKLQVVAEGVETEEQASFLNARGDVIHQGYLFSKPELAADWLKRLAQQ